MSKSKHRKVKTDSEEYVHKDKSLGLKGRTKKNWTKEWMTSRTRLNTEDDEEGFRD